MLQLLHGQVCGDDYRQAGAEAGVHDIEYLLLRIGAGPLGAQVVQNQQLINRKPVQQSLLGIGALEQEARKLLPDPTLP